MLEDQVVIAVVVENTSIGAGGRGGDDQIGRREAVVTALGKLTLRTLSRVFDVSIDQKARKLFEATHVQAMLLSRPCGVPRLQEEGQTRSQPPFADPIEDRLLPVFRNQVPD